jgi:hypothetical protein
MSRNGLDCPGIELFSKNTVLGPPFEFISKIKLYENISFGPPFDF